METFGLLSLIPVSVVIIVALISKRTFEPMLLGALAGFIIIDPTNFLDNFISAGYKVMMDETTVWVIFVCGLFGTLIALIENSGGTEGFAKLATKIAKNRLSALIVTWLLGIIIFIDDYLNALAVGFAMRKVTDKYHIPREELSYVTNSTGATITVLIPFTTWAAFMISQIAAVTGIDTAQGMAEYLKIVPWILYGWIAILIVPLFIAKIIPTYGPLKEAQKRAENGQCLPDSTVNIVRLIKQKTISAKNKKPNALNFIVPMSILGGVTIWKNDILYGVIAGVLTCVIMYTPQKIMKASEFCDTALKGFEEMFIVLAIVAAAFILKVVNDQLGLTPFVISSLEPILNKTLLPAFSFVIVGILAFCTGSFWGVSAIAFPILLPLSGSMGVSVYITAGAVISGATFGSHACFYSDAVTLTCKSCQILNNDYARNVLPIVGTPFLLSLLAFLITGLII